ncbi:glycoside hydrolase family 16 protein [Sodiomyces alcalophilus JCM 7366]|uniref:glycoside hydrolase family 16 protein n=1 Tax=Sodiomyces alcalophilus JCM 7366 TaxID=591952 RepID=UPI0039B663BD
MHLKQILSTALLLPTLSHAWQAPTYTGFRRLFAEEFHGPAGSPVDTDVWHYITDLNVNNELQKYTKSNRNLQISGGGTVQIVPRREPDGGWTSGRIESEYHFTPRAGRETIAEGYVRFGDGDPARKQGLWPAFWLLGQAVRNGIDWPMAGEIDILETVNGILTAHGTVHCDVVGGGACNTPIGVGASVPLADQSWHRWRVVFDRTSGDWRSETITWFKDDQQFHQISGERIGSERVWATLGQSPLYFIMNVAVGGDWPGYPTDDTLDGYDSMMEVAYVAVYESE